MAVVSSNQSRISQVPASNNCSPDGKRGYDLHSIILERHVTSEPRASTSIQNRIHSPQRLRLDRRGTWRLGAGYVEIHLLLAR